jgi:KDO2-lipid IV(A) lauroyltransferase
MNATQAVISISLHDEGVSPETLNKAVLAACLQLIKFDTTLQTFSVQDFIDDVAPLSINSTKAQQLKLSDRAIKVINRHLWSELWVSFVKNKSTLQVNVSTRPMKLVTSALGRFVYRFLPYRRGVIIENITRAYGARVSASQVEQLAKAHYTHLVKLLGELISFRFMSLKARAQRVRVDGVPELTQAFFAEKGIIVLTGHFGNFEVSTVSGIEHFPQVKGRIHFLRRPIKPKWLSDFLTKRFNQAGFGVIGRRGSLDEIVTILEKGEAIVFPFDQYARRPEGIDIPFFDVPAGTHKSMAVIAMATGSPVMPAASWRETDGTHVLKFWPPLTPIEHNDVGQEIRLNTAQYNEALEQLVLAHPEQWWWVHRRWKNQRPVRST